MNKGAVVWGALAAAGLAAAVVAGRMRQEEVSCGPGFAAVGARCCTAAGSGSGCAEGPVPDERVAVPETTVTLGPSDWEAEGRVAPRTIHTPAFAIDAFEGTEGMVRGAAVDRARAASALTRDEAAAYCRSRGGRLPTEDEWIAAAAGPSARRYPWGDTGAVCRRAAWGLEHGPCSERGAGPDTVGAHPDGDTPSGIHDMAGNVAEWVAAEPGHEAEGAARGGSWASALATDLRTWARLELDPGARDGRVGVRCAYDR